MIHCVEAHQGLNVCENGTNQKLSVLDLLVFPIQMNWLNTFFACTTTLHSGVYASKKTPTKNA